MNTSYGRMGAAALLASMLVAGCSRATQQASSSVQPAGAALTPAQQAAADGGIEPYSAADVHFMSGMIHHHAQAVLMAGWATSHDASPSVQALCERIVVAQTDEIRLMSSWLADRHQPVPHIDPAMFMMKGMENTPGMELMPGMLSYDELVALDSARGRDFDHLFLTGMIKHHEGAITMVEDLFATNGAAQDDIVFKFATDVNADQTTEINRMTLMLKSMGFDAPSQ